TGRIERAADLVALLREVVDVAGTVARHRPALGEARRQPDAAWPLPAQPDRRPAGTNRRRLIRGPVQRELRIRERDAAAGCGIGPEERLEHPQRGLVAAEALAQRWQRDAERVVLALVPAGAEAQDEATAGDVVEYRRLLGEDGRVAERRGGDRDA